MRKGFHHTNANWVSLACLNNEKGQTVPQALLSWHSDDTHDKRNTATHFDFTKKPFRSGYKTRLGADHGYALLLHLGFETLAPLETSRYNLDAYGVTTGLL